ncbi:pentapeptide repeat-containing protein, partial [Kitasatospora sp. NPDC057904]|uniref:pentapeptide repeat-containing protein n=1 Tax=Kitasatospora sp. NPDC057904 TaxID=3346275 RepID=UPI0036D9A53F
MRRDPSPQPPDWAHCGHGAVPAADPVGCRGIRVRGYTSCLAHLPRRKRRRYLASLSPGTDIDHSGTPFTPALLVELLRALQDPTTGRPHLGRAWFSEARFGGDASFDWVTFTGDASFDWARFTGNARFDRATFTGSASFYGARFTGNASFDWVTFTGDASFDWARFTGNARFDRATFT